jgi:leucyl-tRNA synthetase
MTWTDSRRGPIGYAPCSATGSGAAKGCGSTSASTVPIDLALAAEHPAIADLIRDVPERDAVERFVSGQLSRTVEERFADGAEKLGVFSGRHAVHPFTGERLPIWIANFVLMDVGTGAIMSVPAHDQRDFEFARAYGLPIRPVIAPSAEAPLRADALSEAFPEDGVLNDSGKFSGLGSAEARARMAAHASSEGFGEATVNYRLKDWGISRQRYWGTPIPVVYCEDCGVQPVPDDQLPVLLPEGVPLTGEGGSALARLESFYQTTCPSCSGAARRETDTMDTFVDSSWYYFRYLDPGNNTVPFASELQRAWTPVNLYIGGIEHATLHLIYTRFWTKMMRDLGLVEVDEPVNRLFTQGMVIKDGAKMSKSMGNVVDPDEMIDRFGADTTRMFCLFAAPPEKDLEWSEKGVEGCHRFLGRVRRTYERVRNHLPTPGQAPPAAAQQGEALELRRKTHRTIRKVTDDLDIRMRLNTALAAIMELINTATPISEAEELDEGRLWALREAFEALARLLSPFAPHAAEELWADLGREGFASLARWPDADPALIVEEEITLVVQVGGKLRGRVTLPRGASEAEALEAARREPRVASHLEGRTVKRVIYVPDKLLNLVAV